MKSDYSPPISLKYVFRNVLLCYHIIEFFQIYVSYPNERVTNPVSEKSNVLAGAGVKYHTDIYIKNEYPKF